MVPGRLVRALGLVLIAASALLLILSAIRGDLDLMIIFIFPVIMGEGVLPAVGGVLLFLGVLLTFLSFMIGPPGHRDEGGLPEPTGEGQVDGRYGGVILIGPLPIVFGSERGIAVWMVVAAIVCLIAIWLALFLWLD